MASVALCWELGTSSGHLSKLAEYIKPLKEQGHNVCLIAKDMQTAHGIPAFEGIDVFQAPLLTLSESRYKPINYSSILLMCGYDNPKNLAITIKAWQLLFQKTNADFVIGEHSPTAVLAAKLMKLSHAVTGSGFMVPPMCEVMPSILLWENITQAELQKVDQTAISNINQSFSIVDGDYEKINFVRDVFSEAHQWLTTFPEGDHYGLRDQIYLAAEPIILFESQIPCWPEYEESQNKEKVFIYMSHESPHIKKILTQLDGSQYNVLAVVPGWGDDLIDHYSSDNVTVQTQLVNIKEVAEQCQLIISHGGYSTVMDFLLLGIPSLLVPLQVESTMFSIRMGLQKLSFSSNPSNPNIDVLSLLDTVKRVDTIWNHAKKFSKKYQNGANMQPLSEVLKKHVR